MGVQHENITHEKTIREIFRRLRFQIEVHPHLTGMQTDEHQKLLRHLWEKGFGYLGSFPTGAPDYAVDSPLLDANEISLEEYEAPPGFTKCGGCGHIWRPTLDVQDCPMCFPNQTPG